MGVPDLSTLLFRDNMFRMPRERLDRRKILPVYDSDSGSIRISGGLNADVPFKALGNFDHSLIHLRRVRGMIHVGID
jgi:hypothetical protein